MSGKWLNSMGLVLDIIGVCILFKYGFPQPDLDDSIKLVAEQKDPDAPRKLRRWKWMSGIGLATLIGGFLSQLLGTWR